MMFDFITGSAQRAESSKQDEISMQSVTQEQLSPEAFLDSLAEHQRHIKSSRFVAPKLGDSHFGYFEVEYKQPVFKPINDNL